MSEKTTEWQVSDVLDLHTFRPSDVRDLVGDYLDECATLGLLQVRIIHGKGKGTLRTIVHSVLERHSLVVSYRLGGVDGGSWGATIVELRSEIAKDSETEDRDNRLTSPDD